MTTLVVAIVLSILVLFLSPIYALIIYITTLVWYPDFLRVQLGTIDFSVCRIVIFVIFVNMVMRKDVLSRFKLIWLDKLVIVYFLLQVIVGAMTTVSIPLILENRAGVAFDKLLPYFVVRFAVTSKEQYLCLLKSILIISAPFAILAFYQCLTGGDPVYILRGVRYVPRLRHGFYRPELTFRDSIMLGLYFAMFAAVCVGLLSKANETRLLYCFGIGLMTLGVLSTVSSGPYMTTFLSAMFIIFYPYRKYWKPVAIMIVIMCAYVEIISNRHFYDVFIDRFTLAESTGWYRSRLISEALFKGGMSDHWLLGYGYGVEPGWGTKIDGRDHTDLVNHYLLILCRFGIVGLTAFVAVLVAAIRNLIKAFRTSVTESNRWLVWCLSSALFGLLCAFMSVSLFDPPKTIFFILLGFCGAMPSVTVATISKPYARLESNQQSYDD